MSRGLSHPFRPSQRHGPVGRAALSAAVLVLAACGPNAESPEESEDTGAPPATGSEAPAPSGSATAGGMDASGDIFVYGFSYESTDDVVARTRVEYTQEQYPDLNVQFSETGFESEGFLTALQAGGSAVELNFALPARRSA